MTIRLVTTVAILLPLLAGRMVRGEATPWWLVFVFAFVAFGAGRIVRHLVEQPSRASRRAGWAIMLGGTTVSCAVALWGLSDDIVAKVRDAARIDAGPAPPAAPWEHQGGKWKALAVGESAVCAIGEQRKKVGCWGDPRAGWSATPAPIADLPDPAEAVAVGKSSACASMADGTVWCWKAGGAAEKLPLAEITSIAAGDQHFCATDAAGAVSCWPAGSSRIVRVAGVPPARAVAAAGSHTCAWAKDGAIHCWGGLDGPVTAIEGLTSIASFAVGPRSACAVVASRVHCWSAGAKEAKVLAGVSASIVAVGAEHVCGATERGRVWCKGKNALGKLGTHDLRDVDSNTVSGTELHTVGAIAIGAWATCANDREGDGEIVCWGKRP